jgi:hypothetical protein
MELILACLQLVMEEGPQNQVLGAMSGLIQAIKRAEGNSETTAPSKSHYLIQPDRLHRKS